MPLKHPLQLDWVVIFLVMTVGASGQNATSIQASQQSTPLLLAQPAPVDQALLQAFIKEQRAISQEMQSLVSQGATPSQIAAWRQQNAARFTAQQQRAIALSNAAALQPITQISSPIIPPNASQTLKDFLTTQSALAYADAQIHNQLVQAMPANPTTAQVVQMQQQESQTFQKQHAQDLQLQTQRAQTLATEASAAMPAKTLPLVIPPNASSQLTAFLTQRNQLLLDQNQLMNQYATADPSVKQSAMQQWFQKNQGRIQQLQQLAQNLAQTNSNNQN